LTATLRDVAREANVSIKTVSRVVNHQGEISDATRQRVEAAIAKFDYRPSKLARGLVTRRTNTVGLILADITNPFFPEVARGVQDKAEAEGFNVFFCSSDNDLEREGRSLESLSDNAVDGLIIFPSFASEPNIRAFTTRGRPLVCVNRFLPGERVGLVMIETRRGARLAVDHLIRAGHRAIGMLAGTLPDRGKLERVRGYAESLAAHGLPVREEWIAYGPPVRQRGYESARQLLCQYPEISALFAYNDLLALGAIQACHELGRRVPEDCAVIGFDDIPLADAVMPALTTVHVDKYAVGWRAMERLLEMIAAPEESFLPLYMDVELIVRQSA
jgi:LacI family transcriptional regulator